MAQIFAGMKFRSGRTKINEFGVCCRTGKIKLKVTVKEL